MCSVDVVVDFWCYDFCVVVGLIGYCIVFDFLCEWYW